MSRRYNLRSRKGNFKTIDSLPNLSITPIENPPHSTIDSSNIKKLVEKETQKAVKENVQVNL